MGAESIGGIGLIIVLSGAAVACTFLETGVRAMQPTVTATAIQPQMTPCTTGSALAVREHATAAPHSASNSCDSRPVVALPNFGRTKLSFRWR